MDKTLIGNSVENFASELCKLSDEIWDYAELAFEERQSCEAQANFLEAHGFSVTRQLAGIETAIKGTWGTRGPVIAFLGEYDALPDLSQECGAAEQKPIPGRTSGQGCGHHLVGTGSLGAALALKAYLEQTGTEGQVWYFGCPAEESGAGKVHMIRRGCFEGVDFALSWHPAQATTYFTQILACAVVNFKYAGISAHAAGNPMDGRSALDAAELTNVGCNYLREHMDDSSRIHYAYLNAGSKASNIVHPYAELEYNVRAKSLEAMNALLERVCNCARGAALMTDTKVDISIRSAYAEFQTIDAMDTLLLDNLETFAPTYTEEELAEAKRLQQGFGAGNMPVALMPNVMRQRFLATGSTDMGDVSWIVPATQACVSCFVLGSSLHSWTVTTQGKSSFAHKGMLSAAKALAATAAQILEDPALQTKIKADHKAALNGRVYKTAMFPE